MKSKEEYILKSTVRIAANFRANNRFCGEMLNLTIQKNRNVVRSQILVSEIFSTSASKRAIIYFRVQCREGLGFVLFAKARKWYPQGHFRLKYLLQPAM